MSDTDYTISDLSVLDTDATPIIQARCPSRLKTCRDITVDVGLIRFVHDSSTVIKTIWYPLTVERAGGARKVPRTGSLDAQQATRLRAWTHARIADALDARGYVPDTGQPDQWIRHDP